MDEQRAWIKSRRKRRLRLLAVTLVFCLLFTTYPNILERHCRMFLSSSDVSGK